MKYIISKADGTPVDPAARYFVLRIDDPGQPDIRAARAALTIYAREAMEIAPEAAQAAMDALAATRLNPKVNPAPCVNSDAQQEKTHEQEDDAPTFCPCPICNGTEANFDGYCQQCEVQLEQHVHEWNPLAALPNSDWQDVCVTCGAHRIVPAGEKL